jgi:hypothetical protein
MQTRPKDTSVEAPAKGTVKEPKGSKLDAKKRVEYHSEVARVEDWDTSAWPTWTVTGRVLPERCDVGVAAPAGQPMGTMGRVQLRKLQVIRSHIVAVCALEKDNPSVYEIADIVRSALWFPIDYIAFLNRGAYEIVLDLCLNNQTGEVWPIPIDEPTFEAEDLGLCFDAQADKSNIPIPWAAAAVYELPTALHDLTAAVRYPRRTFEYCRMAAEAVRRHFDPPTVKGHRERQREGEVAMCAALHLTRNSLQALDAVAARSRHGELVFSIHWGMRKRALEFAWELVARFRDHLQGTLHDQWKLLDVRFED